MRYLQNANIHEKNPEAMARTTTDSDSSLSRAMGWAALGAGALLATKAIYREFTKYDFNGKVVLITGGARGLGLIMARQLAVKGARIALCSRTEQQVERARKELEQRGAEVLALTVDVTRQEQVQSLIQRVIGHYGHLDVLINNAGIITGGPQDSMGIEEYRQAMNIHFWAPLYTMHAVIPHFKERGSGRIVNITSIGGKVAVPHLLPYSASKFAMVGLSEGMHNELRKFGIKVTTVVPHLMRTGSPRNAFIKGNHEVEYALFKFLDSSPLFSQDARVAARTIIKAVEYGEREVILTVSARLATVLQGVAPGWMNAVMGLANRFLPDNVEGGDKTRRGYESESDLSRGPATERTDKAALDNNEV
ncbi:SDR family oxidoreductase [Telluribacter sp.]|jgi:short-subunit dehydrogenase|uniref:SDR family NAD(P)-dependent oxidoreductase n=1 Tax=Telluribacter sp. TaxID=1978767 RepID=UPI002E0EA694|nr:SDR family oxidoreductase [Telluribacter sp.]